MSVTRRACRDRINRKTQIDVKQHTVELISVNADVQWRPSRMSQQSDVAWAYRWQFHEYMPTDETG